MAKRYYWLRLQDDFFESKEIRKLRRIAGGDTYTIIYLKMQLASIKNDGYIEYEGLEENFSDEVALLINEDADNVAVTISFLLQCGLLTEEGKDNFLVVEAKKNLGSESSSAARVRKHREAQKALQCNTDVTEEKHLCNVEKRREEKRRGEIEIEIEESIEEETPPTPSKGETRTRKKKPDAFSQIESEAYREALKDFEEMRKALKKPLTERAKTMLLNKLDRLGSEDTHLKIKILEQSIMHSWQDVYALKEEADQGWQAKAEPQKSKYQRMQEELDEILNNDAAGDVFT